MVSDITLARINQKRTATNSKRINVKLYLSADSDKVVCAEAGADLLDLLLSFLAFPLGSVVGLLEKHSSLGCIDNLYDSVELLSSDYGYMKSEECTNMLLAPMLPPYFGRHYKSLSIWQVSHQMIRTCECTTRQSGKGYARGMVKFMVTDEIEVTTMSAISGFHIINKSMAPISSLEEAEASLGEAEVSFSCETLSLFPIFPFKWGWLWCIILHETCMLIANRARLQLLMQTLLCESMVHSV